MPYPALLKGLHGTPDTGCGPAGIESAVGADSDPSLQPPADSAHLRRISRFDQTAATRFG